MKGQELLWPVKGLGPVSTTTMPHMSEGEDLHMTFFHHQLENLAGVLKLAHHGPLADGEAGAVSGGWTQGVSQRWRSRWNLGPMHISYRQEAMHA